MRKREREKVDPPGIHVHTYNIRNIHKKEHQLQRERTAGSGKKEVQFIKVSVVCLDEQQRKIKKQGRKKERTPDDEEELQR